MDLIERARKYVDRLDAAVSGANGHSTTFHVAVILVQGFALDEGDAWMILNEYNSRCMPPWSEKELRHKLRQAEKAKSKEPRGWLVGKDRWRPSEERRKELGPALPPEVPKARYVPESLARLAEPLLGVVDLIWLANRSYVDPATVDGAGFLRELYDGERERVLVFSEANRYGMPVSQGEGMWPVEALPKRGRCGVWYLAAPVDGKFRETGEKDEDGKPKVSRRNGQCVVSWRWMVVESDEAPVREWLAGIARLPVRVAALYTSGGRSVHALLRTPARTKEEWDEYRDGLRPALITLGADPGCMSAVRLTRLPGCLREGTSKGGRYVKFPKAEEQKLLYLDPRADSRPLCDMPVLRDVESDWVGLARAGVADADETRGEWIAEGLRFYARRSVRCREELAIFERTRFE
jgi:hypothetical protein